MSTIVSAFEALLSGGENGQDTVMEGTTGVI